MTLIYDNKVYRNLEEQVRKNQKDISYLQKIQTVLNQFGIHVLGIKADAEQLPESSAEFGNAYAVGLQPPYEYYIWTALDPTPGWVNIGIFPAPSTVEGPAGPQGTSVTAATIVDSYLVLTLTDADGNDTQITVGYVKGDPGVQGPRGLQGIQGIQGEQGPRGYTGEQGPRGYTGFALDIIALLEDVAELPDPDAGDRHDAYVVQTGDDFELYGKVYDDGTDTFSWENFGLIAFSTNYVTAAQLQAKLDEELDSFVDWVDTEQNPNRLTFYNNYSGNEVTEIDFARINGNPIVGVTTNFQLATKTELTSAIDAIILGRTEVGIAKETKAIKALSDESGETQTAPFIMQGTGTANNTVKVDTSKVAELKAKTISTVEVNQWVDSTKLINSTTIDGVTITNNGDGTLTFSGTATDNVAATLNNSPLNIIGILGHKAIINQPNTGNSNFFIRTSTGGAYTYDQVKGISTLTEANVNNIQVIIANGIAVNERVFISFVDLTQWFGSNDDIPQGLLDYPKNFSNYYSGSLAYSTGTQKSSNGVYLCCGGRNLWNEEWEVGAYTDGNPDSNPDYIRSKTDYPILVIPNSQIYITRPLSRIYFFEYDKNMNYLGRQYDVSPKTQNIFTTSKNTRYIKFCIGGAEFPQTSYSNNVTLSLYYTTGEGYDKYYPYVEPNKYNLSGTIPPVIAIEDYGTMWWEDENNELIEIAQGLTVFYPVDYVGFIDSLSKHLNGNALSVSTLPMLPEASPDGTYVLKATKTGSTITYTWVLE